MLIPLENPYALQKGYNCFGCSPTNENGLRMRFFEADDELLAYWEPQAHMQGWGDVLHGGIQATLLDEIASWVVFVKLQTAGVTTRLDVRYKKPVYVNRGRLVIRARLESQKRNLANIYAWITYEGDETICAEAHIQYFAYSTEVAKQKFNYPGISAFYPVPV